MRRTFKKISALLLVVTMAALAGCAAVQGAAGTATGGGDSALVGDLLTERAVLRALYAEPDLVGTPIQVGCVDGVVTLTGTVPSELERELAARVTAGIDGVTSVNNGLVTP